MKAFPRAVTGRGPYISEATTANGRPFGECGASVLSWQPSLPFKARYATYGHRLPHRLSSRARSTSSLKPLRPFSNRGVQAQLPS